MKIISFSLYGTGIRYIQGAIENALLQPKIYPDWKCRFYYDKTIKEEVIKQLNDLGAETVLCECDQDNDRKILRFLVASDLGVERYICRDTDSRINLREKECVDKWEQTNFKLHLIKDHPNHYCNDYPFYGGMWGGTRGAVPRMKEYIDEWMNNGHEEKWWNDCLFLNKYIVERFNKDVLLHESKDIQTRLENDMFVGQQYTDEGQPVFDTKHFTNDK